MLTMANLHTKHRWTLPATIRKRAHTHTQFFCFRTLLSIAEFAQLAPKFDQCTSQWRWWWRWRVLKVKGWKGGTDRANALNCWQRLNQTRLPLTVTGKQAGNTHRLLLLFVAQFRGTSGTLLKRAQVVGFVDYYHHHKSVVAKWWWWLSFRRIFR